MTFRITDDDIERYAADGAIALRGLVEPAWLDRLVAAIDDDMRDVNALGGEFGVERLAQHAATAHGGGMAVLAGIAAHGGGGAGD